MSDTNNDVEFMEDEDFSGEASVKAKIKKLREKLKECEAEKKDNLAGWQRSKADLINFKRETASSGAKYQKSGKRQVVEDLLPVLDSFLLAMHNKDQWEAVDENWRVGVEYIYNQLEKTLLDHGLDIIDPQPGDEIDENKHDVVDETTSNKYSPGTIASTRRRGYKFAGDIIRSAEIISVKD